MAAIAFPIVLLTIGARKIISAVPPPPPTASMPTEAEMTSLTPYLLPSGASAVPVIDRPMPPARFDPDPYDPTEVIASAPAVPQGARWTVTAILIAGARRMAVVNDELASVGTSLPAGGRVIAIENAHVEILESNGKRNIIPIQDGGVE